MLRMIDIVNISLFPKTEFKSEYVVELTEFFSRAFLKEIKEVNEKSEIDLTSIRRIVYGFAAISKKREQLVLELNSLKSRELQRADLNLIFKEITLQMHALLESLKTGNSQIDCLTTDQWKEIITKEFKFSSDIISVISKEKNKERKNLTLTPIAIKEYLDQYYFGPDSIKETLSRVFYEHLYNSTANADSMLPKRNLLLLGPSGCGKTYVIKKISEFIERPFISFDVTKMSRTGYYGDKVDDILSMLFNKADSFQEMKNGIIFLDEIDKLAANLQYGSAEISTTGVQLDLLKFIEGHQYKFKPLGHRDNSLSGYDIDTSNLLIICGGAFEGVNKIIEKRRNLNALGFAASKNTLSSDGDEIVVSDLIEYGLTKEFAARFQIMLPMPERNVDDLFKILFEAEDSIIKNYIQYFKAHYCNLELQEDALMQIANYAYKQKTGARGLIMILEKLLPMYSVANMELSEFVLTKDIIVNKLGP